MNIIQTWKTKHIPVQFKDCMNSVIHHNSNFNYMFFTDQDIYEFITTKMPEYQDTFFSFKTKIQKIDFFRYLVIYYYGGVYLDLDIMIEKNLTELYENPDICKFPIEYIHINDTFITDQGFVHLIGNYAFYAPAKHPFIKKIIDNIVDHRITKNDIDKAALTNGDSIQDVEIYCTTGPIMVTQSYIDMENKKSIELLTSRPFRSERFGMFGQHLCYGTWR
tara:strand:+ start:130 stop:789 length:660 start_codon:yes stop_codon:yes gene_type:complete